MICIYLFALWDAVKWPHTGLGILNITIWCTKCLYIISYNNIRHISHRLKEKLTPCGVKITATAL